jgi:C-terminal processing protease CtpA/Prc
VGDEDYDNILYASGQNNRIETERVLGESTADNAGIRPGDRIISYAGKRIFDESSLITLTAGGEAGENTRVEVLRDGEIVYLIVPRGPLGIKFAVIRVPPGS